MATYERHVFEGTEVRDVLKKAWEAGAPARDTYESLAAEFDKIEPEERTAVGALAVETAKIAAENWFVGIVALNAAKFDAKKAARMTVLLTINGVTKPAIASFFGEVPGNIYPLNNEDLAPLIEKGIFDEKASPRKNPKDGKVKAPAVAINQFRGKVEPGATIDEARRSIYVETVILLEEAIKTLIDRMIVNGKKYIEVLNSERRKAPDVAPDAVYQAYVKSPYGQLVKAINLLIVASEDVQVIAKAKGPWLTAKMSPTHAESPVRALEIKVFKFSPKVQRTLESSGEDLLNYIARSELLVPSDKTKKRPTKLFQKTGKIVQGIPEMKEIKGITDDTAHTLFLRGGKGQPYVNYLIDFIWDCGYLSFHAFGISTPSQMESIMISKTIQKETAISLTTLYAKQKLVDTEADTEAEPEDEAEPEAEPEGDASVASSLVSALAE